MVDDIDMALSLYDSSGSGLSEGEELFDTVNRVSFPPALLVPLTRALLLRPL